MKLLNSSFSVSFRYPVYFTKNIFSENNILLKELLRQERITELQKILFVIDHEVQQQHPFLTKEIRSYFSKDPQHLLCKEILLVPGGEHTKKGMSEVDKVLAAIERNGLCRHSYVVIIGGGAVLDMVGFAATIAHRGIRHIRIPTTVLSQNDSGIGVKNGVNAFGKKNFIGTFSPPFAVINDSEFLKTLTDRDWRSGIAEAIKVALIKDEGFFDYIKFNAPLLVNKDMEAMEKLIYRCGELHLNHITEKDPFEKGSSRSLDFGHWSAHKLEQMTSYRIRHGEAVAIGMALDATISLLIGTLPSKDWENIISLLEDLGFEIYIPELSMGLTGKHPTSILKGLAEFREHLGGELTIMLLEKIGKGIEVNHIDERIILQAVEMLQQVQGKKIINNLRIC